jgi:hypothetical protein
MFHLGELTWRKELTVVRGLFTNAFPCSRPVSGFSRLFQISYPLLPCFLQWPLENVIEVSMLNSALHGLTFSNHWGMDIFRTLKSGILSRYDNRLNETFQIKICKQTMSLQILCFNLLMHRKLENGVAETPVLGSKQEACLSSIQVHYYLMTSVKSF